MKERLARNIENLRHHLGAPAVGAAIVGRSGATAVAVSGMTEIGGSTAVTDEDAWHIGSCTKTITALTVASLIEEGLLEWDTPLSHVFADLNGIDSGWNAATVEDLLQCRAGIGANLPFGDLHDWHSSVDSESDQRSSVAAQTLSEPPQGLGKFVYSNLGYILVGALIDRVADRTYERAVFDRILNPLGATDSGFGAPPRIAGHRRALQVGPVGFGRLTTLSSDEPPDNPRVFNSAGRLHLPLAQWAKVIALFLDDGPAAVSVDSRRRLATPPPGGYFAMGWGIHPRGGLWMQGSNTLSGATVRALGERAVLVTVSDARRKVMQATGEAADQIMAAITENSRLP